MPELGRRRVVVGADDGIGASRDGKRVGGLGHRRHHALRRGRAVVLPMVVLVLVLVLLVLLVLVLRASQHSWGHC